jgi:hypothetical protein
MHYHLKFSPRVPDVVVASSPSPSAEEDFELDPAALILAIRSSEAHKSMVEKLQLSGSASDNAPVSGGGGGEARRVLATKMRWKSEEAEQVDGNSKLERRHGGNCSRLSGLWRRSSCLTDLKLHGLGISLDGVRGRGQSDLKVAKWVWDGGLEKR